MADLEDSGGDVVAMPRKRLTTFLAGAGSELDQARMPFAGVDASVMAGFAKLMAHGATEGTGEWTTLLFSEPGDTGMTLVHVWFKSGYVLPRHSHDTDCLYYVLAGELRLGTRTLGRGDGMFIPAEAAYTYEAGPAGVEVLEFRNATRFNLCFKQNDDSHWDRMADAYRDRADVWAVEPPPSTR